MRWWFLLRDNAVTTGEQRPKCTLVSFVPTFPPARLMIHMMLKVFCGISSSGEHVCDNFKKWLVMWKEKWWKEMASILGRGDGMEASSLEMCWLWAGIGVCWLRVPSWGAQGSSVVRSPGFLLWLYTEVGSQSEFRALLTSLSLHK